jgi:hypothetical protein
MQTRSSATTGTAIEETGFAFRRLEPQIAAQAVLDGLYVIRTSVVKKQMISAEAVRSYKALAEVERAFRAMRTIDLLGRPAAAARARGPLRPRHRPPHRKCN